MNVELLDEERDTDQPSDVFKGVDGVDDISRHKRHVAMHEDSLEGDGCDGKEEHSNVDVVPLGCCPVKVLLDV